MSEKKIIDLLKNKKFIEAKILISKLLNDQKHVLKNNFYYGLILAQEKKFEEAIKFFKIFHNSNQTDYDVNFNIAGCYLGLLNFYEAIKFYNNCVKLDFNKHEPFHQIGVCYRLIREYEKSEISLNKALAIKENPNSYYILGKVLRENGQFEKSRISFERSISLDDKFIESKLSLANLENDFGNYEKAIEIIEYINASSGSNDQVFTKSKVILGNILKSQGDYQGAIDVNIEILKKDPKNVDALYNLSLCYLFTKNYEKGWRFHESRYNLQNFVLLKKMQNNFQKPRWDENKQEKSILIYGEQGIGEQILYSQFVKIIRDKFENITIAVNKKLIPFFNKIFEKENIIDYRAISNYENYDCHLPMGSLGLFFQKFINHNSFKEKINYSLEFKKIPKKNKKFRCGISWRSTNKIFGNKKSIELEELKDFFLSNNIEFINLQYTDEDFEIKNLERKINRNIFLKHDVDCFDDIDGVASLIKSCDIVITVSNSNAHISGKLGVKTFLLLPFNDGKLWYWGMNTDTDIIWYPSIEPIRMNKENDWNSCISKLNEKLENFL